MELQAGRDLWAGGWWCREIVSARTRESSQLNADIYPPILHTHPHHIAALAVPGVALWQAALQTISADASRAKAGRGSWTRGWRGRS